MRGSCSAARGDRRSGSRMRSATPSTCGRWCSSPWSPRRAARSSGSRARWAASIRSSGSASATACPPRTATAASSTRLRAAFGRPRLRRSRARAARDWCAWEDAHVACGPVIRPTRASTTPASGFCFARLVTHYWRHAAWLEDGELERGMARLAGIPGMLIQGGADRGGARRRAETRLARSWPDGVLEVVEGEGHGRAPGRTERIIAWTDPTPRGRRRTSTPRGRAGPGRGGRVADFVGSRRAGAGNPTLTAISAVNVELLPGDAADPTNSASGGAVVVGVRMAVMDDHTAAL